MVVARENEFCANQLCPLISSEGNYTCIISNSYGELRWTFTLHVYTDRWHIATANTLTLTGDNAKAWKSSFKQGIELYVCRVRYFAMCTVAPGTNRYVFLPFCSMFGHDQRLRLDWLFACDSELEAPGPSNLQYVRELQERLTQAYELVNDHTRKNEKYDDLDYTEGKVQLQQLAA